MPNESGLVTTPTSITAAVSGSTFSSATNTSVGTFVFRGFQHDAADQILAPWVFNAGDGSQRGAWLIDQQANRWAIDGREDHPVTTSVYLVHTVKKPSSA